jgi:manganese/zinc/iron transport system substrate-binding protein
MKPIHTNTIIHVLMTIGFLALAACDARTSGGDRATATADSNPRLKATGNEPYSIVVTTAMIGDIVRHIAGDRAAVHVLMGPGVDPHLYRPTRDDIEAMLKADLVFYNGLNLEGKMGDAFVKAARGGRKVFAVTEMIDESYLLSPESFAGHDDPHVWMDPGGWRRATDVVVRALVEFDSANASEFESRGKMYGEQLERLDEYARQCISSIPESQRVLVTAHDAFNYFARAYGIEVRGIQGISTESEAGLQQIEQLVSMLVSRRIPAVFTESSVSDKNVRALVEGAAASGHAVTIGGELFSDAMGAPGTYEGTYVGMIDHNATVITRALGGTAPPRGMSGKLAEQPAHDLGRPSR